MSDHRDERERRGVDGAADAVVKRTVGMRHVAGGAEHAAGGAQRTDAGFLQSRTEAAGNRGGEGVGFLLKVVEFTHVMHRRFDKRGAREKIIFLYKTTVSQRITISGNG